MDDIGHLEYIVLTNIIEIDHLSYSTLHSNESHL